MKMTTHLPLGDCPRCAYIERYTYRDLRGGAEDLPAGLEQLVGHTKNMDMAEHFTACPECGAYYLNTNAVGFGENDIEVTRVSPTRAGVKLTAEQVATHQAELQSTNPLSRDYAAECLKDYFTAESA